MQITEGGEKEAPRRQNMDIRVREPGAKNLFTLRFPFDGFDEARGTDN